MIKVTYKLILILFFAWIIASCNDPHGVVPISLDDYEVDSLNFHRVQLSEPVYRPRLIFPQPARGILTVYDEANGGAFKVYKHGDGNFLYRYPEEGDLKNALSFIDESVMGVYPNKIQYLDFPFLREVEVDTIGKSFSHLNYFDASKIEANVQSLVKLNDELYMARNPYFLEVDSAHVLFSSRENRIVQYFGTFPEETSVAMDESEKSSFFRYRVSVNPEMRRVAVFYVKYNRLRIYNFDGVLLTEAKIDGFNQNAEVKEQRLFYESPIGTEKGIYVLFFGQNYQAINAAPESVRPEIHYYNWDGELQRRYKTNASIYKFHVDAQTSTVMAVTFDEHQPVVKTRLD